MRNNLFTQNIAIALIIFTGRILTCIRASGYSVQMQSETEWDSKKQTARLYNIYTRESNAAQAIFQQSFADFLLKSKHVSSEFASVTFPGFIREKQGGNSPFAKASFPLRLRNVGVTGKVHFCGTEN